MKFTIVTASDSNYFVFLDDLISSLRVHIESHAVDINVLDVGLSQAQRAGLSDRVNSVIDPDWTVEIPKTLPCPTWYKAQVSRPYLPKIFPDYDLIMWIDADCWIQDWKVIPLFVEEAKRGKIAIVPEVDRSSCHNSPALMRERMRITETYLARLFGHEFANAFKYMPIFNAGVFCMRSNAPHWQRWASILQKIVASASNPEDVFFSDQASLNFVIHSEGLPFAALPLYCNWNLNLDLMVYDRKRCLFLEPDAPNCPIGIVHMTGSKKTQIKELQCLDGSKVTTGFSYGDWKKLKAMSEAENFQV
jgi:lipopolysaccharide biosynthesis glycosyltransferase